MVGHMTLSQQTAVLLEAVDDELLQPDDIVRWADKVIIAEKQPSYWLIELSTLNSPYLVDYVRILRPQASSSMPLPMRSRIQIIILAYYAGLLSFRSCLPKLFRVMMVDHFELKRDALDARLADALVDWDFQEDLDKIEASLRARFDNLFREYLMNVSELSAVLPWKHDAVT
jgi:hypothetical protein